MVIKILELVKKYRDVIYISLLILGCAIMSTQCSRMGKLNDELKRQENNQKALTDTLSFYQDELGRVNAEKHAYQLTQEELRDSIGLLKKRNHEYLTYINTQMGIKDTVTIETVIVREVNSDIDSGHITFNTSEDFGKSSRSYNLDIPYKVEDNTLYTENASLNIEQNIFVEGWIERNKKTDETYLHLRSDYPGVTFNSGMGVVAENGKQYEKSMRKSCGVGIAVGPCISMGYDMINKTFSPSVGVGVVVGFTYTPKSFQW